MTQIVRTHKSFGSVVIGFVLLWLISVYTLIVTLFSFLSQDITSPPILSPVKVAGKKRAMATSVSDDEDSFIPRYIVLVYV